MAAWRSGGEQSVHMPADDGGAGAGHGQAEVVTPERRLNCFLLSPFQKE